MRRALALIGIAATVALSLAVTAGAAPGNGTNAVLIFNNCDHGVGQVTLVSQASAAGRFATAHVVGTNRPAPLISLQYDLFAGDELIESGGFEHSHPQQGQPVVTCSGSFTIDGLRFEIQVTGFFPAGP
jgi:hypothetical protein